MDTDSNEVPPPVDIRVERLPTKENYMRLRKRTLQLACFLLALTWAGTAAQAQFLLTGGRSGGQLQIGTGLPLPIGPAGIFLGGMTPGDAGPENYPPLLVPPNPDFQYGLSPTGTIAQDLATAQGGEIVFPPSVLSRPAPGSPTPIAVFPTNPAVMQVATTISYAWPNATATLGPNLGPGSLVTGTDIVDGIITYSAGQKAFGGAAQFSIAPGPGAGTGRVPQNGLGVPPVATVWINFQAGLPTQISQVLVAAASNQAGVGQAGRALTPTTPATTMFGPITSAVGGFGAVNVTTPTPCCTMGPQGTIPSSIPLPATAPSNMVTGSRGFPWTTGFITISQPNATPAPEVFFLSGSDNRGTGTMQGQGNISLVSGALSQRALSGPNSNRGWLSLTLATPEPTAALGAAGALTMLGLCHMAVRRRRSR